MVRKGAGQGHTASTTPRLAVMLSVRSDSLMGTCCVCVHMCMCVRVCHHGVYGGGGEELSELGSWREVSGAVKCSHTAYEVQ